MNKTERLKYFQGLLNKGLCVSLKKERNDDFKEFMELFKHHPEYETKLKDVVDLCIVRNKRCFKFYEINLIKNDGSKEDISYRCCINKPPKNNNLLRALRYTIEGQIKDFRENNELICDFCKSVKDIEIDHIITFKDLINDFLKNRDDIPDTFDDNEYNGCKFKDKDIKFKDDWFEYHKNKANLRCLCKRCNLSRNYSSSSSSSSVSNSSSSGS